MAKDEHAIFVDAAGTIFLGHQIHSVFEWRDEGDVAAAVVREKIFAVQTAKMILHRQPSARRETAVDIANEAINAVFELVISGDLYAARHNNLDENHATAQFRVAFQRVAKCAQSFGNSLAVIEPVHTQD